MMNKESSRFALILLFFPQHAAGPAYNYLCFRRFFGGCFESNTDLRPESLVPAGQRVCGEGMFQHGQYHPAAALSSGQAVRGQGVWHRGVDFQESKGWFECCHFFFSVVVTLLHCMVVTRLMVVCETFGHAQCDEWFIMLY